jgi:hypothetical protein
MFPYIFYLNKDVQEHNRKMLNLVQSKTITLKSYDKTIDSIETNIYRNMKMKFPFVLDLKQNMLVELIGGNYVIEDGLVDGVEIIFRSYTKYHTTFLWIKFTNPLIGMLQ